MERNSSSSRKTSNRIRLDGPLCETDLTEFRALCDQIIQEKQIPFAPDGTPTTPGDILDVLREACVRTLEALAEADEPQGGADSKISEVSVEEFVAIRKAEGLKIDARNAEVTWWYAQTLDPYGIHDLPDEYQQVGRGYFARAPGSDIWVSFYDLPSETRDALWQAHKHELAFSAGLPIDLLRQHSQGSGN